MPNVLLETLEQIRYPTIGPVSNQSYRTWALCFEQTAWPAIPPAASSINCGSTIFVEYRLECRGCMFRPRRRYSEMGKWGNRDLREPWGLIHASDYSVISREHRSAAYAFRLREL